MIAPPQGVSPGTCLLGEAAEIWMRHLGSREQPPGMGSYKAFMSMFRTLSSTHPFL